MRKGLLIFIVPLLLIGCIPERKERTIKLQELTEYQLIEKHTPILLIKSYIIEKKCNPASYPHANLYLCETFRERDTVIVVSICKVAHDFLRNEYTFKEQNDLIIDSTTVSKIYPTTVISSVTDDINYKKYRFIVADIIALVY